MNNNVVNVRDLGKLKCLDIAKNLKGGLNILFEDGIERHLISKEIIMSRYYWEVLYNYPKQKILSTYVVSNYYKSGLYSSKTHIDFLYTITRDLIYGILQDSKDRKKTLSNIYSLVYDVAEALYNELSEYLKDYVISIDLIDLLDIQLRDEVMESIARVKREMTNESINSAHEILDRLLREDELLKDNPAVIAYISEAVSGGQMKAMLSSNGFKTDSNGKIFPYPVTSSFMLGLDNMYEVIVESRTAVKALILSTKGIQSTETFAKELQLLTMYIERIRVDDDCGSTSYLEWFVSAEQKDINNLLGSYYLNEETNQLELITEDSKHIIGTKIKLRNPIGCKHWDKHGICGVCYGDLGYQVPATANLGHFSAVNPTGQTTQLSFKTKHQQDSASAETVILDEVSKKFFNIRQKSNFCINKINLKEGDKLYIEAPQEFFFGIRDVNEENIEKLDVSRVTRIPFITVRYKKKNLEEEVYRIDIKRGNRFGHLSSKFLGHILENPPEISSANTNYVIDISKLKENTPVIILPDMEYSYLSLALEIKGLLKQVNVKDNAYTFLAKLYNLVNSKLKINIAYLSVIVRALMVKDVKHRNYDLSNGDNVDSIAKMMPVIKKRSLSNALILGWAAGTMTTPSSFEDTNRPNSSLDVLFRPEEAIYWSHRREKVLESRKNEMRRKR